MCSSGLILSEIFDDAEDVETATAVASVSVADIPGQVFVDNGEAPSL